MIKRISPTSPIEAIKKAAIEKHGLEAAYYLAFWGNYPPNQKTCWWKVYKLPKLSPGEMDEVSDFVLYLDKLNGWTINKILYPSPPTMYKILLQPLVLDTIPF